MCAKNPSLNRVVSKTDSGTSTYSIVFKTKFEIKNFEIQNFIGTPAPKKGF